MAQIRPDVVYRTPEGIIGGGPASAAQPNRCRAMGISIAPSAVVDPTARIKSAVSIGPGPHVGPDATIGIDAVIGPHARIAGRDEIERCLQSAFTPGALVSDGFNAFFNDKTPAARSAVLDVLTRCENEEPETP